MWSGLSVSVNVCILYGLCTCVISLNLFSCASYFWEWLYGFKLFWKSWNQQCCHLNVLFTFRKVSSVISISFYVYRVYEVAEYVCLSECMSETSYLYCSVISPNIPIPNQRGFINNHLKIGFPYSVSIYLPRMWCHFPHLKDRLGMLV